MAPAVAKRGNNGRQMVAGYVPAEIDLGTRAVMEYRLSPVTGAFRESGRAR